MMGSRARSLDPSVTRVYLSGLAIAALVVGHCQPTVSRVAKVIDQVPARHLGRSIWDIRPPTVWRDADSGDPPALPVPGDPFVTEIDQLVLANMIHHQRRMRIDDDLSQSILAIDRVLRIDGDPAQEVYHGLNPLGVNAIFRLLQADHPFRFRIEAQDRQDQESEGTIGKGTRWMEDTISPTDFNRPRLRFVIGTET